jgi:hypothetical protein
VNYCKGVLKCEYQANLYVLDLIHINKVTRKTPMPAPRVKSVATWMALIHSLPVNREKFQKLNAKTKKAITIPLSGDLCLMIFI